MTNEKLQEWYSHINYTFHAAYTGFSHLWELLYSGSIWNKKSCISFPTDIIQWTFWTNEYLMKIYSLEINYQINFMHIDKCILINGRRWFRVLASPNCAHCFLFTINKRIYDYFKQIFKTVVIHFHKLRSKIIYYINSVFIRLCIYKSKREKYIPV